MSRRDVEREKYYRKIDEEQLEFNEWSRKRDVVREEVEKKYEAELEELKKKCEAEHLKRIDEIRNGPPIPYPIIPCMIPRLRLKKSHHYKSTFPSRSSKLQSRHRQYIK